MKHWKVNPLENAGKYRHWFWIIAMTVLFTANKLHAQGGCAFLTPSFINYEPCKYRVQIVNTSECTPSISVLIDPGEFEAWSANTAGGWTGQELAPNLIQLTHSQGFVPLGTSFPIIFTLPVDLVTNGNFTWEFTCGLGEGCTLFPGIELVSCPDPKDASIIGVKYRECGSLPYGNQPTLSGWTIQAFDENGALVGEAVTEADGSYGIYDLPKGQYTVREGQKPGWTSSVPASGEALADLGVSEQLVRNFGNCPSCSCDNIYMDVVQLPISSDTCSYILNVSNNDAYCFNEIDLKVAVGSFASVTPAAGWTATMVTSKHYKLTYPPNYIPAQSFQSTFFKVTGAVQHDITVSTAWNNNGVLVTCSRPFSFQCPPPVSPLPCCPMGSTFGPELVKNSDFSLGNQDFTNDYNYFTPGGPSAIGGYSVLDYGQVYTANNQWACIDHTTYTTAGPMLIVDGYNGPIAWEQQVSVTAGTTYSFSAWFNNLVIPTKNYDDPQMAIWVNGSPIASTPILTENSDEWKWLCAQYTATQTGLVTLQIRMLSTTNIGNDVGIDDISFKECIPPPSCVCLQPGAFSNMSYRPNSGPNVPIACGQIAFWQCNFPTFNLSGDFMCQGNSCPSMPPMFWTLNHPSLGQVNQGTTSGTGFSISIPNSSFTASGLYTLTIAGICGMDTCYCDIIIETPGCGGSDCIEDFETGSLGQWQVLNGQVSIITDPFTGSQVLQGSDNSGASWMYNNSSDYSGDWTQKFNNCFCFNIRYDRVNPNNPPTGTSAIVIYQGSDPLSAPNRATFIVSTPIGNSWTRVCVPIGLANGTTLPFNTFGTWTETPSGVFNSVITNVSGIGFIIDFAGGSNPSELLFVDSICIEKCTAPCTADIATPTDLKCGKYQFNGFANGLAPYTYCWDFDGNTNTCESTIQNPMWQFPASGTYTVTLKITDATGCMATYSLTVVAPALPTVAITANPANALICAGSSATLQATAGFSSYVWSPNVGNTANVTVTPNVTTTYTVVATDANGCTASASITVTVKPLPIVTITGPSSLCLGQSGSLTANAPTGSSFVWQPSGATGATLPINTSTSGVYGVMVTATLNGCTATAVATYTVHPSPPANAGPDQLICQWQTAVLSATGGNAYQWTPNGSTNNPYVTAPVQSTTTYTVVVTDGNGCTASDQVTVNIQVCDCATNPIVQNNEFSIGNPCAQTHEDIQSATSWGSIWPDGPGLSTGDFYNTTTCTPSMAFGALTTPVPVGCGNFGGFWCNPNQSSVVWREGILNNLTPTNLIAPNSGTYQISMKMACLTAVSGSPRMSVYGVLQGANSTVPSPNALTTSLPTNPDLFELNNQPGAVLLGKVLVSGTCTNNYMDVGFSFNANTLPGTINRIFLTRDDNIGTQTSPNWGGSVFLAVDSFCVKPVLDTAKCECGNISAYMYRPQDGWISPIFNAQPAIPAPCPKPASSYYVFGQFSCSPDQCGSNCVDWVLDRPSPLPDLVGQNCGAAYPWFVVPINNADCSLQGNYALTMTRLCGSKPCTKVFNFKIDNCPCPCDSLKKDVAYGFSMSTVFFPPNQCKKKFKPLVLCANDQVSWTIQQVGGPYNATGNSVGNAAFQFGTAFSASGYYDVCMTVIRTVNGVACPSQTYCRRVYIQCGILPAEPTTRFCDENEVRNGGFNEVGSAGLLDDLGYLPYWVKAGNPGDGKVIVEDTSSAGSLDEGYLVMLGRQGNFAGIAQEVNLTPDTYLALYFDAFNYQGADMPAGTKIEVRLQDQPFWYSDLKTQVLKLQMLNDTIGWQSFGGVMPLTLDTSLHYLVICLQNEDDTRNSVVGLDNIEICSSSISPATEVEYNHVQLRIYPNPNPGTFTAELPEEAKPGMMLRVIDLAGRLVQEQKTEVGSTHQTVRIPELPAGLYFLQVIEQGKVLAVEKFVKQ